MNEEFYIGYLPKSPPLLARVTRRTVAFFLLSSLVVAGVLAVTLPYFGKGTFDFRKIREFTGTVRCGVAPRLSSGSVDYLLVGRGKHAVAPEICGANGDEVTLRGSLIQREGRQVIEVASFGQSRGRGEPTTAPEVLGHFTLTGEIVDSKCYFGVMNPAEGRAHRACAVQCLRGGVPAVFVARDRMGAATHLLLVGADGAAINDSLLRWTGESVEASGEVVRQGQWLVLRLDSNSLRLTRG